MKENDYFKTDVMQTEHRLLFFIICTILVSVFMNICVFAQIMGEGTKIDPYKASSFEELKQCLDLNGYVQLQADITNEDAQTITINNKKIYLDMNGCKLWVNSSESLFELTGSTEFVLEDTKNSGVLTYKSDATDPVAAITMDSTALFVMDGGTIYSDYQSIEAEGTVVVNGGTIISQKSYAVTNSGSSGELIVNGGIFRSEEEIYAISFNCDASGTKLCVCGGEIYGLFGWDNFGRHIIENCTIHNIVKYSVSYGYLSWWDGEVSVTIDGENHIDPNLYKEASLEGDDIVFTSGQSKIANLKLNGNIVPTSGMPLLSPTTASELFDITSTWYDSDKNEVTGNAEEGKTYDLTLELNAKNRSYFEKLNIDSIYFDLTDTDYHFYTIKSMEREEQKVTVNLEFKPMARIVSEPEDLNDVKIGDYCAFVSDMENATQFQWHLLDPDGNTVDWSNAVDMIKLLSPTNEFGISFDVLTNEIDGYSMYCVMTGYGTTATTRRAFINLLKPVITTQPKSINIDAGGQASFAIEGENIESYYWHISDPSDNEVTFNYITQKGYGELLSSTVTGDEIILNNISDTLNGYKVYCVVSCNGFDIVSDKVSINVNTPAKKGDIDADDDIDDIDAAMVLKYICATKILTPEQLSAAYVNGDEVVDMLDVIAILQNKTA